MKRIRQIAFWLCIVICVAGVSFLAVYHLKKEKNQDIYAKVQSGDYHTKLEVGSPGEIIPIDFEALKEVNSDIYAWIEIKDTNINYPIVQSAEDDSYYLEHTIEGVKGYPGSIYTEKINAKDFSDFLTVVYGHDMKDGSMFKHLHKFEDATFFEENDLVTIYTETAKKEYRIFAAVVYDNRHLMYSFDYDTDSGREAFIQSLYESHSMKSHVREGVEVGKEDHILVMSTCITGQPDKRYIVGAVEVHE